MRNARDSIDAIVKIASLSCFHVSTYALTTCLAGRRSTRAAARIARKHAVPDVPNELSSYIAAYGVGRARTGGSCVIKLWRPGIVKRLSCAAVFTPPIARDGVGSHAGNRL